MGKGLQVDPLLKDRTGFMMVDQEMGIRMTDITVVMMIIVIFALVHLQWIATITHPSIAQDGIKIDNIVRVLHSHRGLCPLQIRLLREVISMLGVLANVLLLLLLVGILLFTTNILPITTMVVTLILSDLSRTTMLKEIANMDSSRMTIATEGTIADHPPRLATTAGETIPI